MMYRSLLLTALAALLTAPALADYKGDVTQGQSPSNPSFSAGVANGGQISNANPEPVTVASGQTFTFSQSATGDIALGSSAWIDAQMNGDLAEADVHFTSVPSGAVVTFFGSNDQQAAFTLSEQRNDGQWTYAAGVGYANNQWTIPLKFRYFKMSITGTFSGSITGTVTFKTRAYAIPPGALSSAPSYSLLMGTGSSNGASPPVPFYITAPDVPVAISNSATGTTQLVVGVANKSIYVTDVEVKAGGTTNLSFVYGTGSTCTSPTSLTGAMPMATGDKFSHGAGLGAFWTIPAGLSLCIVNSTGVSLTGFEAHAQR